MIEYHTCIYPGCGKPLGYDTVNLDYRVCHEHRTCSFCNDTLRPPEIQVMHDKRIADSCDLSIDDFRHPRCNSRILDAKSPIQTIKQTDLDYLNLIRTMIEPNPELSKSVNENNAVISCNRFLHNMSLDDVYVFQGMLEGCLAATYIVIGKNKEVVKKNADKREAKKFEKAQQDALTSSRPVGTSSENEDEKSLGLFMANFNIKSRKVALKLQKQRDIAVDKLAKALKMPTNVCKDMADRELLKSINEGKISLEENVQ